MMERGEAIRPGDVVRRLAAWERVVDVRTFEGLRGARRLVLASGDTLTIGDADRVEIWPQGRRLA